MISMYRSSKALERRGSEDKNVPAVARQWESDSAHDKSMDVIEFERNVSGGKVEKPLNWLVKGFCIDIEKREESVKLVALLGDTGIVYIQLRTGAICHTGNLAKDHVIVTLCILVLLVILSVSALAVPISKKHLEVKYREMQKATLNEELVHYGNVTAPKLRDHERKYWIMAETGNPQFVMALSATCFASGTICILAVLIFLQAVMKLWEVNALPALRTYYIEQTSDYKWSICVVFWIQCLGILTGSIAPAIRWFTAISFMYSRKQSTFSRNVFKVESYWIQMLLKRRLIPKPIVPSNHARSGSDSAGELDHSHYLLQLEGKEELSKGVLNWILRNLDQLFQKAKQRQPKNLMELLGKSTEGLVYDGFIEKSLDIKEDILSIRNAGDMAWVEVELYRKWLGMDLQKMALKEKTVEKILQKLSDIAIDSVTRFKKNVSGGLEVNPHTWPVKVIAATSMYRITQTILLDCQGNHNQIDEELFHKLSVMIADLLGACLTNLLRATSMKCFCGAIEEREKSIIFAARLLGETEEILQILQQFELPTLDNNQLAYIDQWRALAKHEIPSPFVSSSSNVATPCASGELHIPV
ncbi:hypothetical protein RJ640_012827 [Escallonia rubra]|uniref:Uncharacterized protein n=1 Tax=Escallonia rubra TaxID=112253 RepID=A0AA88RRR4_9ASTE|nr:hypothetical protein RJ640_012827 [Escallonia rubra]